MADLEHVRWIRRPELRRPHVIAAFTGWNDAADAASTALRTLIERLGAAPLAEIDPEEFTDFATIRPHVRLADGSTRSIVWPTVSMWSVTSNDHDLILVLAHNDNPPVPGLGSAIFWHVRQPDGRPTEGCVAMGRDVLARWLDAMAPGDAIRIEVD